MAFGNDLVFKFLARFVIHDTVATAAGPPAGYDDLLREPIARRGGQFEQVGPSSVVESAPIDLPVQVQVDAFERLQQAESGDQAATSISLCTHERYLRRLGLLDANGRPILKKSDRLLGLYTQALQPQWLAPPSQPLYVQELRPRGHGLSLRRPRRNLWFIEIAGRPKGR